jgi:hypothetical protein
MLKSICSITRWFESCPGGAREHQGSNLVSETRPIFITESRIRFQKYFSTIEIMHSTRGKRSLIAKGFRKLSQFITRSMRSYRSDCINKRCRAFTFVLFRFPRGTAFASRTFVVRFVVVRCPRNKPVARPQQLVVIRGAICRPKMEIVRFMSCPHVVPLFGVSRRNIAVGATACATNAINYHGNGPMINWKGQGGQDSFRGDVRMVLIS